MQVCVDSAPLVNWGLTKLGVHVDHGYGHCRVPYVRGAWQKDG